MSLDRQALSQFDSLVEAGELLWKETRPVYVSSVPFNFQFRVATSLKSKPRSAHQKTVRNAFSDDNPDFSLGKIGSGHRLILNKFCVVRPQFVLHTIEFEPQNEPLSDVDCDALWEVLSSLGNEYIAIFNCGPDAGASVGHKHMQIIPRPNSEGHALFPDVQLPREGIFEDSRVPFRHVIQSLSSDMDRKRLPEIYRNLRDFLGTSLKTAHNVILVSRWMMVIPRTKAGRDELSANAAAMIGMVWMDTEQQLQTWTSGDPMLLLQEFGVPRE